jgi:MraZ protein
LDSNGRILIPKRYLLVTDIQNDIRFVGMDNRIEMWAKEKTEQPFMDLKDFGNALQEVMKGENER